MRTILILMMLATSLFVIAPTASACEVEDPTGHTTTCVDTWEYENGDCTDSHWDARSVTVKSTIPAIGTGIWVSEREDCSSSDNQEGRYISASVGSPAGSVGIGHTTYSSDSVDWNLTTIGISAAGNSVMVTLFDYQQGSHEYCSATVYVYNEETGWTQHKQEC